MDISVIIPTCNRNDFLIRCLDSIAPPIQTIDPDCYEVIVTDDSKHNSAKPLFEEKYTWAKWVEGPKRGPASNRNNGARHAVGKWLVFLDDDCLPVKEILKNYIAIIEKNSGIDVFEGKVEQEGRRKSHFDYAPCNGITGGVLLSCNFCIRKDLFDKLNGFDENFKYPHMEDFDLKERIDATGKTILFVTEAKVIHPWRKVVDGIKLGKYAEMTIYFNAKHGIDSNLLRLLKPLAVVYWSLVKRSLFQVISLPQLKSL